MTSADVREWREQHGLTQSELGQMLGVHYTTVQRWERDERAVPSFLALALIELDRQLKNRERERARQRRVRAERSGTPSTSF